ncbi:MAG: putative glycoside hydrolase, partial [Verrucomicrobiota bacterium]
MKAIGITIAKAPVFSLLLLLTLVAFAQPLQAAVPGCENTQIRLTPDYRYFIGSAEYQSAEGDPEWGSSYRWLADGTVIEEGTVGEGLLLHLDAGMGGANGESPVESNSVAYVPGRWGSALALPENGRLQYSTPGNLDWEEGTIEMWVALRQDGTNAVYSSRDHLLFQYLSPKGDFMQIGQSASGRVIHVGGMVSNEWESAYGIAGSMVNWKAGEWHHIAFTFSVKDNSMKMYIDGAFSAANNEGHYYAPEGSGATFSIGSGINSPAAEYYIDEVRISGRAATADEIVERARRVEANSANEVWLASSNVTLGAELVFEFTAASGTNHGVPCQSAPVQANGIPVYNAGPPSTLLKAGSTNFNLRVESAMETECRYSVGSALPYDQMTPFGQTGGTAHESIISGINPDPNQINDVYVRCGAAPDYLMHLQYRVLSQVNPSYPRKGNLWGWTQWIGTGLSNMAKVDLWLGVAAKADEIITLRQLNPNIRVLTSINAVEGSGVPEEYYLKDLNGNKIEVWPGSYRLNLTKPEVAEYQARHAYETVLKTGLMADGVFFDNFMTRQAWLTNDIYGNPVQLDANEDGVADDLNELDRKWRDGVFLEMALFRKLMPDAIVTGHSMDIDEPGIAESFNGISIGFAMAHVLEGKQTFDSVLARYNQWMSEVVDPQVTMIESSPMEQIAYGYGYANTQRQSLMNGISDNTLEFARTFYPYMRFGLGFTLMNDGYFTHEFGDIWHGNQWWYDELDYNLGQPLGAAREVRLPDTANTNRISNGSFEAVSDEWGLVAGPGCAATFARDENGVSGSAARIDISATTGTDWHIEFAQANRSVEQGVEYDLTLWVKSDAPRAFTVNGQKGTPDWTYYGL